MTVVVLGVPMGASHGIGHQPGPLGVGHGETSCILLRYLKNFGIQEEQLHLLAISNLGDKSCKTSPIPWMEKVNAARKPLCCAARVVVQCG